MLLGVLVGFGGGTEDGALPAAAFAGGGFSLAFLFGAFASVDVGRFAGFVIVDPFGVGGGRLLL